jgi:hypothetical protein
LEQTVKEESPWVEPREVDVIRKFGRGRNDQVFKRALYYFGLVFRRQTASVHPNRPPCISRIARSKAFKEFLIGYCIGFRRIDDHTCAPKCPLEKTFGVSIQAQSAD